MSATMASGLENEQTKDFALRLIDDRKHWEFVEKEYKRGNKPFVKGVADRITRKTLLPAPAFNFCDEVIAVTRKAVNGKVVVREKSGIVQGMTWVGNEWEYTFISNLNVFETAMESELVSVKPEKTHALCVYQDKGDWVYDDDRVNVTQEPFVLGMDTLFDRMTVLLPHPENGFVFKFSEHPFPGFRTALSLIRYEDYGYWYKAGEYDLDVWICAHLHDYIPVAPGELYIRVEPLLHNEVEAT